MCTQIVCGRLVGRGLVRVDTPAYGDCQFEAVCMSAKLLVSASVLRKQVCDDMDRRRIYPKDFIDYLRVEGNYRNEQSLIGVATLLRRPVILVTDGPEANAVETINPADTVPSERWLQPLVLAYYIGRHYEGTVPSGVNRGD